MKLFLLSFLFMFSQLSYGQCSIETILIEGNPDRPDALFVDLDQDGDEDVLFCGEDIKKILFYENDGFGNFSVRDTIITIAPFIYNSIKGCPTKVYVEDFDNDSHLDIAVQFSLLPFVWLYKNDGASNFTFVTQLDYVSSGGYPRHVGYEDMDADGVKDFIYSTDYSGFWLKNLGGFNFSYQGQGSSFLTNNTRSNFCTVDLNNDGMMDIVSSNSNRLFVNLNDGINGLPIGQGVYYGVYESDVNYSRVLTYDYDNDNDADVVILNSTSAFNSSYRKVLLYENNGTGQFSTPSVLYTAPSQYLFSLLKKDINMDGIPDIVFGQTTQNNNLNNLNSDVIYLQGTGTGFLSSQIIYSGHLGDRIIDFADLNNDMNLEMLQYSEDQGMGLDESINIYEQASPLVYSYSSNLDNLTGVNGFTSWFADLDSDGDDDMINGTHFFQNQGNEHLEYLADTIGGEDVAFEDIDNDGNLDVVAIVNNNVVWNKNLGNGFWEEQEQLSYNILVEQIELSDLNLDGNMDLVMCTGASLYVKYSQGNGTFGSTQQYYSSQLSNSNIGAGNGNYNLRSAPSSNVVGELEFVLFNPNDNNVYLFLEWLGLIEVSGFNEITNLEIIDIDNDGIKDILFVDGSIQWMKNNGNGTFQTAIEIYDNSSIWSQTIKIADMDNDGLIDIVSRSHTSWISQETDILWLKNLGNAQFSAAIHLPTETLFNGHEFTNIADINGDGFKDIIYNDYFLTHRLLLIDNSIINAFNTSSVDTIVACGSDYIWPETGATYQSSGIYIESTINNNGCDSLIVLDLILTPISNIQDTVISCNSYTWMANNSTYAVSGIYADTLSNINGCDSIINLDLTILSSDTSSQTVFSCGDYFWPLNGSTYSTDGAYQFVGSNILGCDSLVTIDLTIGDIDSSSYSIDACDSYTWGVNNQVYTASGIYTEYFVNSVGCDSILILDLTLTPISNIQDTVISCNNYTWIANNTTYELSGIYTDTLSNINGCDSILSLDLTILPSDTSSQTVFSCGDYFWPLNGNTYSTDGAYQFVGSNILGCDSLVTIDLTIGDIDSSSYSIDACDSYTWGVNNQVYTSSGTYSEYFVNSVGCDSILMLDLVINQVNATVFGNGVLLTSGISGDSYQWIDCDTDTIITLAISNTFTPSYTGNYAVIVFDMGCSDTSNCIPISIAGEKERVNYYEIFISPNPSTDYFEVISEVKIDRIEIYDVLGRRINSVIESKTVDISALTNGSYFVKVFIDNYEYVKEVLKY